MSGDPKGSTVQANLTARNDLSELSRLGEFLAAKSRAGPYGGSLANRTRLARDIITAIRTEVPGVTIASRMNVYDCIPYRKGANDARRTFDESDRPIVPRSLSHCPSPPRV